MEMAGVMSQSIQIDDGFLAREEEIKSRLVTENKVRNCTKEVESFYLVSTYLEFLKIIKIMYIAQMFHDFHVSSQMPVQGLRDMLEISRKSGSLSNPLVGPKKVSRGCQTDDLPEEPACCPTAGDPAGLDSTAAQEVTFPSQIKTNLYSINFLSSPKPRCVGA